MPLDQARLCGEALSWVKCRPQPAPYSGPTLEIQTMRFIGYLLLLALIAFGIWPYYSLFRLDDALGKPEVAAIQDLVDLPAIQANYKKRLTGGMEALPVAPGSGDVMVWLPTARFAPGPFSLKPSTLRCTYCRPANGPTVSASLTLKS